MTDWSLKEEVNRTPIWIQHFDNLPYKWGYNIKGNRYRVSQGYRKYFG
jgi:hypothetical protein